MMADINRNETQNVIERANQTELAFPFIPVSEQIHIHALAAPDQTAVICMGKALSYGELERLSNRAANLLNKKGIGRDVLVGVLLERTELAYVAEQSVLKAHGASERRYLSSGGGDRAPGSGLLHLHLRLHGASQGRHDRAGESCQLRTQKREICRNHALCQARAHRAGDGRVLL